MSRTAALVLTGLIAGIAGSALAGDRTPATPPTPAASAQPVPASAAERARL